MGYHYKYKEYIYRHMYPKKSSALFTYHRHPDGRGGFLDDGICELCGTRLQSHQQWRSVPLSPHPCQHLLSPEFLILAILTGVRWNLRVVLICISLMIKDAEHFFRCFSAIRYSSGENSLFSSEPHFLMGLFPFP